MKALTAAEMRDVDRLTTERYGVPGMTLMENAGTSVAEFLRRKFSDLARRRIVVLCGKGNNGGDGFVVARKLRELGAKPEVYSFAAAGEMRGDAALNRNRWQETGAELRVVSDAASFAGAKAAIASADLIVDALLGTGTRGRGRRNAAGSDRGGERGGGRADGGGRRYSVGRAGGFGRAAGRCGAGGLHGDVHRAEDRDALRQGE